LLLVVVVAAQVLEAQQTAVAVAQGACCQVLV
jgi:hypothetical protein